MTNLDSTPISDTSATAVATKVCKGPCGLEKPVTEFGTYRVKSGEVRYQGTCKACYKAMKEPGYDGPRTNRPKSADPEVRKQRKQETNKKYNDANRETKRQVSRDYTYTPQGKQKRQEWVENNREKSREIKRRWAENNPEKVKESSNRYSRSEECRKKSNERSRIRRKEDPNYRLVLVMRCRISNALKGYNEGKKVTSTIELLGCNVSDLRSYLSTMFYGHMSWDNYEEWDIDHIVPCAAHDLDDPEQQRKCFHYTNLQPLFRSVNQSKHDKLDFDVMPHILATNQAWAQETFEAEPAIGLAA